MRILNSTRRLLLVALVVLVLTPLLKAQSPDAAAMLLEAAIQKELIDGDLRGAITGFERIVTQFPDEPAVTPQVLWHLGQAYERIGDSRARQTYQRLVEQFATHRFAARARTRLDTMFDEVAELDPSETAVREDWSRPTQFVRSGALGQGPEVIFTDLSVFNRNTKQTRRLTSGARSAAYPVAAPGGQRVAYLSWSGDLEEMLTQAPASRAVRNRSVTELRVVDINGANDRVVFRSENIPWMRPFAWSPDARQILTVFERNDGRREIALVNANDGAVRTLASPPWLSPQGMGFSPEGSYIAYQVATPRNSRQWDFFIRPVDAPSTAPIVERRYSLSLAAQRGSILSEDQMVIHLLNRLGFGPRPGDLERVKAMGVEAYIEQQLQPEKIADPAVEAKLADFSTLRMDLPALLRTLGPPVAVAERRRMSIFDRARTAPAETAGTMVAMPADRPRDYEIHEARIIRAVHSERQLLEVVVDFWMNHFNARLGDHQQAPHYEEQAIRRHAFGKFEDLLRAVATHPRMLVYLDNWRSSAPADVVQKRVESLKAGAAGPDAYLEVLERLPFYKDNKGLNENYARELMELHTLGVDGGYTQRDVQEVAKILTGWTISGKGLVNGREDDGVFYFDPVMHVDGDKQVLGRTFTSGGMGEGEQLLKMLATHPSTARFISTKLARRFIADDPPPAVIDAASRTFLRTGGDIREVLRTILTSPQFRSPEAYQSKIKKPFELVVSAMRAVKIDVSRNASQDLDGVFVNNNGIIGRMGERLYNYEAPDGNPDVASAWINSNALLARLDFANALATGQFKGFRPDLRAGQRLLEQLGMPRPTPSQIEQTRALMQAAMSASGGASPQMSNMMAGASAAASATATPIDSAAVVVAAMLGSPQFQKR